MTPHIVPQSTQRLFASVHANSPHEVVRLIVDEEISVDCRRAPDGATTLHVACAEGKVRVARALLQVGASADMKDINNSYESSFSYERNSGDPDEEPSNFTPLSHAAMNGHVDCMQVLYEHTALLNVDTAGWRDLTPLHLAVLGAQYDAVVWLLEHDASPLLYDSGKKGNTPLRLAVRKRTEYIERSMRDSSCIDPEEKKMWDEMIIILERYVGWWKYPARKQIDQDAMETPILERHRRVFLFASALFVFCALYDWVCVPFCAMDNVKLWYLVIAIVGCACSVGVVGGWLWYYSWFFGIQENYNMYEFRSNIVTANHLYSFFVPWGLTYVAFIASVAPTILIFVKIVLSTIQWAILFFVRYDWLLRGRDDNFTPSYTRHNLLRNGGGAVAFFLLQSYFLLHTRIL